MEDGSLKNAKPSNPARVPDTDIGSRWDYGNTGPSPSSVTPAISVVLHHPFIGIVFHMGGESSQRLTKLTHALMIRLLDMLGGEVWTLPRSQQIQDLASCAADLDPIPERDLEALERLCFSLVQAMGYQVIDPPLLSGWMRHKPPH